MRRMMLDVPHPRAHDVLVEADGTAIVAGSAADARHVARAIGERLLRPVPQDEERLSPQMRARPARDGKQIDLVCADAAHLQTRVDGSGRKSRDVLDSAEPLLFNGRDEFSVPDEGRGHIAVICVQPEDVHRRTSGIDGESVAGAGRARICAKRVWKCRSVNIAMNRSRAPPP